MTDVGWTINTLREHSEALRAADEKFQEERDRRYAEVNVEREKALKIKETADRDAMSLDRENRAYKDKQNDTLREQTLTTSGVYATHQDVAMVANKMETSINLVAERMEAALLPLATYVSSQKGSVRGSEKSIAYVIAVVSIMFGLIGLIITIIKL